MRIALGAIPDYYTHYYCYYCSSCVSVPGSCSPPRTHILVPPPPPAPPPLLLPPSQEYDKAIETYHKGLELEPDNEELRAGLQKAIEAIGR